MALKRHLSSILFLSVCSFVTATNVMTAVADETSLVAKIKFNPSTVAITTTSKVEILESLRSSVWFGEGHPGLHILAIDENLTAQAFNLNGKYATGPRGIWAEDPRFIESKDSDPLKVGVVDDPKENILIQTQTGPRLHLPDGLKDNFRILPGGKIQKIGWKQKYYNVADALVETYWERHDFNIEFTKNGEVIKYDHVSGESTAYSEVYFEMGPQDYLPRIKVYRSGSDVPELDILVAGDEGLVIAETKSPLNFNKERSRNRVHSGVETENSTQDPSKMMVENAETDKLVSKLKNTIWTTPDAGTSIKLGEGGEGVVYHREVFFEETGNSYFNKFDTIEWKIVEYPDKPEDTKTRLVMKMDSSGFLTSFIQKTEDHFIDNEGLVDSNNGTLKEVISVFAGTRWHIGGDEPGFEIDFSWDGKGVVVDNQKDRNLDFLDLKLFSILDPNDSPFPRLIGIEKGNGGKIVLDIEITSYNSLRLRSLKGEKSVHLKKIGASASPKSSNGETKFRKARSASTEKSEKSGKVVQLSDYRKTCGKVLK